MDCWLCEWVGGFGLGDQKENTDDLMLGNGQVCDLGFRRQAILLQLVDECMEWAGMGWTQSQNRRKKFSLGGSDGWERDFTRLMILSYHKP